MNEHIITAREGEDVTIKITGLQGVTAPSAGMSGHVPPGQYLLKTRSAKLKKKAEGKSGFNIVFEDVVVAPAQFAGTPIITYTPVPTGEAGNSTFDTGMRALRDRLIACCDVDGTLDKVNAVAELDIRIGNYVGKTFAAILRDGKGEYADRSEMDRMITKVDYDKSPGPTVAFGGSAPVTSKPQGSVPEVGVPAGATATGAQASAPAAAAAPAAAPAAGATGAVNKALGWG
jgi:hypothetical protein